MMEVVAVTEIYMHSKKIEHCGVLLAVQNQDNKMWRFSVPGFNGRGDFITNFGQENILSVFSFPDEKLFGFILDSFGAELHYNTDEKHCVGGQCNWQSPWQELLTLPTGAGGRNKEKDRKLLLLNVSEDIGMEDLNEIQYLEQLTVNMGLSFKTITSAHDLKSFLDRRGPFRLRNGGGIFEKIIYHLKGN